MPPHDLHPLRLRQVRDDVVVPRLAQLGFVARDEGHTRVLFSGEQSGDLQADPLAAAGNQHVSHECVPTICGASIRYITGVTIRASNVDEINPPMITHASGAYSPLPWSAIGNRPPIAVRLVSTIGRNRTSPAFRIASSRLIPSARNRFVRSTRRIEVLISMPISATNPIVAANESVCPAKRSASTPPAMPRGMTDATISVARNVRNSSTRIARITNVATMIAPPMSPKLSCRLSISPAGTIRYSGGRLTCEM